jgi:hypothetical protein
MVKPRTVVLFACGALIATAATVAAQRYGQREPRNGVCFYEDEDFGGNYFCVRSGENMESMPSGMNDRISSIRVFGNGEVTLFRDPSFEGTSATVQNDVTSLRNRNWNDRISSLQVHRGDRYSDRSRDYGSGRYGQGASDADRIVRRSYQDVLGRAPDREGLETYRSRVLDEGWSEADVREDLRRSAEYRQRTFGDNRGWSGGSREAAENIVRRAYRSVLNREPDAGSEGYVQRVLRDGWSQQDVERELRQSPEYRNRIR